MNVTELTTFEVDPQGTYAKLYVRDQSGAPACVVLPTPCLNQLLMTLPGLVQTALRNSHGDDSLRLVHALDEFLLEAGEPDVDGRSRYILTLKTGLGFTVSFVVDARTLAVLGNAASKHAATETPARTSRLIS